jgi:DNA recombination protein RmuC
MTISPSNLIIIIAGAVLVTAILLYFVMRQMMIGKSEYQSLKEEEIKLKNLLELEQVQKNQINGQLEAIKEELTASREKIEELNALRIAGQERMENFRQNLDRERELNEAQKKEIEKNAELIIQLNEDLAVSKARQSGLFDKIQQQKTDFEEIRKRSLDEFKLAANALLEEKSERFAKFNKDNIEQILKPLGENLSEFKKQVKESYDKEAKERFSLEGRIKELVELNNQISKEAQNLTNALKGQAKTQGDWGEMILENILEHSGLSRNREYFVQESFRDENGQLKRPDIIVKYPDNRYIIIDSKVSLTAYERFSQQEDTDLQKMDLAAHLKSIRTHIDELSAKEYDKFDKTLDFVMLFVPIEPAYLLAMQNDHELWHYAYSKRILLISPTNLIAALKMVADIWKRDDQNRNARKIAKRGEMLYDKFVGFVSDLESIEKHINRADDSWKEAMKKLKSGRGNLIGQADKLRKLGIEPKNKLPDALLPDEEE